MMYIGRVNGAGCVYAEGLSNTALGALWSGGNADGFAQYCFTSYDFGLHAHAALFLLTTVAEAHRWVNGIW